MKEEDAFKHFICKALNRSDTQELQLTPVLKGGSDREFYRVDCGGSESYIFMWYNPERTENNYYPAIAEFLLKIGIHVPRLFCHDAATHFILMEDLGETDLWYFRDIPWEKRRSLYKVALAEMLKIQACDREAINRDSVRLMPDFDGALYNWEHDYFLEQFVKIFCSINLLPEVEKELKLELAGLTEAMLGGSPRLVHRDFQSQNIIVQNGCPVLIDFQGLRFGSPFYDLGSLLYDPYVDFTEEERMELLTYYHEEARAGAPLSVTECAFRLAASQRLMQALGAYGFLGIGKGLTAFLTHIPRGLANLIDATNRTARLPVLNALALQCRETRAVQQISECER